MAVDERTPRHHVVDELVAVDVPEARTAGSRDEERRGADRLEGANRTIDAAGQQLDRPRKKLG
jgi:hypothetical protein